MSYQSQAKLLEDHDFQVRMDSCCTEQAHIFKDDARPDFVALAQDVMRDGEHVSTFVRLGAGAPGVADKVEQPNGAIDSSLVTDGDLLAIVQANWPTVTSLYYTSDGTALGG